MIDLRRDILALAERLALLEAEDFELSPDVLTLAERMALFETEKLSARLQSLVTASAAIATGVMTAGAMHGRATIAAASHVRVLRISPPSAAPWFRRGTVTQTMSGNAIVVNAS